MNGRYSVSYEGKKVEAWQPSARVRSATSVSTGTVGSTPWGYATHEDYEASLPLDKLRVKAAELHRLLDLDDPAVLCSVQAFQKCLPKLTQAVMEERLGGPPALPPEAPQSTSEPEAGDEADPWVEPVLVGPSRPVVPPRIDAETRAALAALAEEIGS